MSNFVEQINDAIKVRIAAVVPTFSEMKFVLNVSLNNSRNNANLFGVRPLSAFSQDGVTNQITLEQSFEIILSTRFINKGSSDLEQRDVMFTLYDQMDVVFEDLLGTKAGIPAVILLISEPSMAEPEYLDDDHVAVLRGSISIRYRRPT